MSTTPGPGRRFPSGGDYREAIQHTGICFADPELKASTPLLDNLRLPRAISGAFASVFSLTSDVTGKRYAVKCFTQAVAEQERRYHAISDHLRSIPDARLSQPWKVGFDYIPEGILVRGSWYPVLKMDWVEAQGLIPWIEANLADPVAIATAAGRFATLAADLGRERIGHGDFQHGNLLVARDGTFRLVDYDGMYVPALAGLRANEKGLANYQSPLRDDSDFGPDVDRFSAWLIYASLAALAVDPSLWGRLHPPGEEFLLLGSDDFTAPEASGRLGYLLRHQNTEVQGLATMMRRIIDVPLAAIPELAPVTGLDAAVYSGPHATGGVQASPVRNGALPSWMAGHVVSAEGELTPPVPVQSFAARRRADWIANLASIPLAIAMFACLFLAPPPTEALGAALIPVWLAIVWAFHRTHPQIRAARSRLQHIHQELAAAGRPDKDLAAVDAQRTSTEQAEQTRKEHAARRQQELAARQKFETGKVDRALATRLADLDRRRTALDADRRNQLDAALRRAQDEHIRGVLARRRVDDAVRGLSNMGPGAATKLAAAGIRTAADFTGVRYVRGGGQYNSVIAYFVLRNGREIRVPSIGEVRAGNLEKWRSDLESRARVTAPTQLSPTERDSIVAGYTSRSQTLGSERATAEKKAAQDRAAVIQAISSERARMMTEQQRAEETYRRALIELDRRAAELRDAVRDLQAIKARANSEAASTRGLSYGRYLKLIVTGR